MHAGCYNMKAYLPMSISPSFVRNLLRRFKSVVLWVASCKNSCKLVLTKKSHIVFKNNECYVDSGGLSAE